MNSLRQKLLKLSGLVDSQKDRIESLTNDLKLVLMKVKLI